jgi:hypothetical protein
MWKADSVTVEVPLLKEPAEIETIETEGEETVNVVTAETAELSVTVK